MNGLLEQLRTALRIFCQKIHALTEQFQPGFDLVNGIAVKLQIADGEPFSLAGLATGLGRRVQLCSCTGLRLVGSGGSLIGSRGVLVAVEIKAACYQQGGRDTNKNAVGRHNERGSVEV